MMVPVSTAIWDGDSLSVSGVDTSGANQYGTLTFHADGSYTYALDNNNSTVQRWMMARASPRFTPTPSPTAT